VAGNILDAVAYLQKNQLKLVLLEAKFLVEFPSGYKSLADQDEILRIAEYFQTHDELGPGAVEFMYRYREDEKE
jgi:hypothetical protein